MTTESTTIPNGSVIKAQPAETVLGEPAIEPTSKPVTKPPLERPFSLSLPPEDKAARHIVGNIDASNRETERLTKKTAEEQILQAALEERLQEDALSSRV